MNVNADHFSISKPLFSLISKMAYNAGIERAAQLFDTHPLDARRAAAIRELKIGNAEIVELRKGEV